ncbi:MAG: tetratricopeptide repeat protein [Planctomycetes bacterium]|nr:tetratricopeptide repeat protein [Planctomycetota bacterium]
MTHEVYKERGSESDGIGAFPIIFALLLLAVIPFITYCNSLDSPFVGDAIEYIERNNDLAKPLSIEYLTMLRPLNKVSYRLNRFYHGFHMPGWHLVNIAIHAGAGMMLFLLLRRILKRYGKSAVFFRGFNTRLALGGALLFSLHPVHTQAVNYLFARSELLCGFFLFTALYLHAGNRRGRYGFGRAIAVSASFLLALASKERAFMFLPGFILFDLLIRKESTWPDHCRRWLKLAIPMGLVTALGLINFFLGFEDQHLGAIGIGQEVPPFVPYFLTEMVVRFHYLKLLFWPADLSFDYYFPLRDSLKDPVLLSAIGGHLVLLAISFLAARRHGWLSFGLLWFALFILPTSGAAPAVLLMHEHWIYASSFGFFLILLVFLQRFEKSTGLLRNRREMRWLAGLLSVALCFTCGWTSYNRNKVWQDPLSLWQDASLHAGEHYWVWNHLGVAYLNRQDYDQAMEALEKAETIGGPNAATRQSIGVCLMEQGRLDEALQCFKEALALSPGRPEVLMSLGQVHKRLSKPAIAIEYFKAAWNEGLITPLIIMEMAQAARMKNDLELTREFLQQGMKMFPNHKDFQEMWEEIEKE